MGRCLRRCGTGVHLDVVGTVDRQTDEGVARDEHLPDARVDLLPSKTRLQLASLCMFFICLVASRVPLLSHLLVSVRLALCLFVFC